LPDQSGRRWLGLIAIALGVALIVVDITIVSVIIPSIIADLRISSAQAQWIQESYAIVLAALLLLVGRVADILGARRVFTAGVVLFGVTSMIAGIAPGGGLLIAARFAQGTGAAMILPTSLALLNTSFTGKARDKAFAVWGSTIGAAAALGPVLGGWLAVHASWRWAFGINVPLAVLVCVGVLALLPPSPRTRGARGHHRSSTVRHGPWPGRLPGPLAGQGSGIQSAFRQLGSALGIAALTTVFFTTLSSRLRVSLTAAGLPASTSGQLTRAVSASAGAVIRSLAARPQTAPVAGAARQALTGGLSAAAYAAAAFVALGLIATALIPARRGNHGSGPSPSDGTDRPPEHARSNDLPPQHQGT
jgi:MFS family permease